MHLYERTNQVVSEQLAHFGFDGQAKTRTLSGDFDRQIIDVMPLANRLNVPSLELAEQVADRLRPFFADVAVIGKGLINIRLHDSFIVETAMVPAPLTGSSQKHYVIDFGGPNIAKALHVGHLRSLVIGESLRRILVARGHHVVSDIHLGDWGLPMGMLVAELMARFPDLTENVPDGLGDLLETLYPEVVEACKVDPDLMARARTFTYAIQNGTFPQVSAAWGIMRSASLEKIKPLIDRLRAHFDLWYGESDAMGAISLVEQTLGGKLRRDKGAMIIEVAEATDKKELPPLIFQKGDGGYTYAATDLATIIGRRGYDLIYVADSRHKDHFEQVFRAAKHFHNGSMTHVGFGTINGSDGKPFKTRDGGVPSLEWMLDTAVEAAAKRTNDPVNAEKIAIGAIKFADLITHRNSGYTFDLDRMMTSEGKTGPYVQYAHIRASSILRNFPDSQPGGPADIVLTHKTERDLLLACASFPEAVALAETSLVPTFIADSLFTVAQKFSAFYTECPVKGVELSIQRSRLAICYATLDVLATGLHLLGIEVPSKM